MSGETQEKNVLDLGSVEDIPVGEGREYTIGQAEIAIFRTRDRKIYAVQAKCPHRSGYLADGMTGNGVVVCPFHSYKFDLSDGKPLGNDCRHLRTYEVKIGEAGQILLTDARVLKELTNF
jgi:nitrite reductase (NADH) small subunit